MQIENLMKLYSFRFKIHLEKNQQKKTVDERIILMKNSQHIGMIFNTSQTMFWQQNYMSSEIHLFFFFFLIK